jgi:hypothetical protein
VKSVPNDRGGRRSWTLQQTSGRMRPETFGKKSFESDRILYKKDGHKREMICPQIKWGSAFSLASSGEGCFARQVLS